MIARVTSFFALALLGAACGSEDVDLRDVLDHGDASLDGPRCLAPPGACNGPDVVCTARSQCCSGRCEPQSKERKCLASCAGLGQPCSKPEDCCSLGCATSDTCVATVCAVVGTACAQDTDCCSNKCDNLVCAAEQTSCGRTGSSCAVGGDCCSGTCNPVTSRCDLGPGPCREPSSPCMMDVDCCRGNCLANAQGIPVCTSTSTCLADGLDCNGPGDCCGGSCTGSPARCRSAVACDP